MGYLGTGLPFALGARSRHRVVRCAPSSATAPSGFHVMELETAVRESLPVVVVVAVDDAWGMVGLGAWGRGEAEWATAASTWRACATTRSRAMANGGVGAGAGRAWSGARTRDRVREAGGGAMQVDHESQHATAGWGAVPSGAQQLGLH